MKTNLKWRKSLAALVCMSALLLTSCGSGGSASGGGDNAPVSADTLAAAEYLSGDYPELPADGETYNFSVAYASGENTETQEVMVAWKEALEYYSGGKMTMTLYPNGQLGSDSEIIASCIAGDIDIVLQSGSTHATFVPETQIFDTPFLFSGVEMDKIEAAMIDSEFRDMYNAANERAGLKCLMLKAAETMDLTSNRPVYSMEDLQGLKIRTAQTESRMLIWSELGANPTPLAYSELYMALQNGTVDASDNIYSNHLSGGFGEQQDYIIPTDHFIVSMDTTMNLDVYNSLPAEYQEMLDKICEEITYYDYALTLEDIESNFQALVDDYGLEVCEISEEFQSDMEAAAQPAIDEVHKMVNDEEIYAALERSLNQ